MNNYVHIEIRKAAFKSKHLTHFPTGRVRREAPTTSTAFEVIEPMGKSTQALLSGHMDSSVRAWMKSQPEYIGAWSKWTKKKEALRHKKARLAR
jgi:hypothetical protein